MSVSTDENRPLNLCFLRVCSWDRVGDLNKAIAGFDDGIRVSTYVTHDVHTRTWHLIHTLYVHIVRN
jgi:hypothetical protein